jgi:hypothetical protein
VAEELSINNWIGVLPLELLLKIKTFQQVERRIIMDMKDYVLHAVEITDNKKLVSDTIIMKEISNHTLTQDKAEEREKELADKSMKELGELLDSISKQPTQRTTANIQNPTVPNNASDFLHKDKGDADTKDSQKENRKTVKDFADSVINNLPV